jgi:hypothetical protein
MRSAIGRAINTDPDIIALGMVPGAYFSGDADSIAARPYIVARYLDRSIGVGESRPQGVTFYVHDKPNDFTRINTLIFHIRRVLTNLGPKKTDTGWITQIDWLTDSGELSDDVTRTIVRQTSFTIIASGV